MTSISTCFFASTPKYKFEPHPTVFYVRPSLRLCSIGSSHASLLFSNKSLKLRRSNRRSVALIRASVDVAPSAFRPGAAVEGDKLTASVRKRAMDAIDSLGRRVTVGDVASKAGLELSKPRKLSRLLPLIQH